MGYRGLQRYLMLSLSVEAFSCDRLDVDGSTAVQLLELRPGAFASVGIGVDDAR
ncbi:hypothetical protein [Corallococcus terminator]|uniref:hypothetical protein n=1 Tax=Corallococcus terminator TaxID=2316733 RepID=UPI001315477C|nr:hypothetical protein [Corallococcus terminator]